jgi:hypothetical protein
MHAARQNGDRDSAGSASPGGADVHNYLRTCRYFFGISVTVVCSAARSTMTHHNDFGANLRIPVPRPDPEM